MYFMIIKCSIPKAFWSSIFESQSAMKFLEEIEKLFAKSEKVVMNNLLAKLITMNYKDKGNIKEYITKMSNLAPKLQSLKLAHTVGDIDKWSLNKLISHCVQEEERLQRDKTESVHFASTSQNKKRNNIKSVVEGSYQQKKPEDDEKFTCHFYKKSRHMKKQYSKYHVPAYEDEE
ncbi:hypothetical protein CR513_49228, partial [Mucuna pruriens]